MLERFAGNQAFVKPQSHVSQTTHLHTHNSLHLIQSLNLKIYVCIYFTQHLYPKELGRLLYRQGGVKFLGLEKVTIDELGDEVTGAHS